MHRRAFLIATAATSLTGCATFDNILGVTDIALAVPKARAQLEAYLSDSERQSIADDLLILDRTYQPLADAIYGNANVTLEGALDAAFGTALDQTRLEAAYKSIRTVVLEHERLTKEPVPPVLSQVSAEIEDLWDSWRKVAQSQQRAVLYLRLAARLTVGV